MRFRRELQGELFWSSKGAVLWGRPLFLKFQITSNKVNKQFEIEEKRKTTGGGSVVFFMV